MPKQELRGRYERTDEVRARQAAAAKEHWRHIRELDHLQAALCFHFMAQRPGSDRGVMALFAQRAFDTAPPLTKRRWEVYRDAIAGGREVRLKTFPLELMPSPELLADMVDEAFDEALINRLAQEEDNS